MARAKADENDEVGGTLFAEGRWIEAAVAYGSASEILGGYVEPLFRSRVEAKIGACHLERRDNLEALAHFHLQLEYAELHDDEGERAEGKNAALHNVALAQWALGKPEDALFCLGKVAPSEKLAQRARTESLSGVIHESCGRFKDATAAHKRDLALSRKIEDLDGECRALINCGLCTGEDAFFDAVIDLVEEADDDLVATLSRHSRFLATALYMSAAKKQGIGRLERAAECFLPLQSLGPRPAFGLSEYELEEIKLTGGVATIWGGRPEDATLASMVHSALSNAYSSRVDPDNAPRPDPHVALWHAESARHYAQIAQLADHSDLQGFAAASLDYAALYSKGVAYALRSDLKEAAAAFSDADAAARKSSTGSASTTEKKTGDPLEVVFQPSMTGRQRSAVLMGLQSAAKRGQAACLQSVPLADAAWSLSDRSEKLRAAALCERARCKLAADRTSEARADAEEALILADDLGLTGLRVEAYLIQVEIAEDEEDWKTALNLAKEALELATEPMLLYRISQQIANIYLEIGVSFKNLKANVESVTAEELGFMLPDVREQREADLDWLGKNAKVLAENTLTGPHAGLAQLWLWAPNTLELPVEKSRRSFGDMDMASLKKMAITRGATFTQLKGLDEDELGKLIQTLPQPPTVV